MLKKLEEGNETFRGAIGRYSALDCDATILLVLLLVTRPAVPRRKSFAISQERARTTLITIEANSFLGRLQSVNEPN